MICLTFVDSKPITVPFHEKLALNVKQGKIRGKLLCSRARVKLGLYSQSGHSSSANEVCNRAVKSLKHYCGSIRH